jgi:ribosomal protein L11 methylase PrmA
LVSIGITNALHKTSTDKNNLSLHIMSNHKAELPPTSRLSSSFRDPSGFLFKYDNKIYRQVNPIYEGNYNRLMSTGLYQQAVERGWLITHDEIEDTNIAPNSSAYKVLLPEQLQFVSYPYEWSFSQLKDAALLTLSLQKLALDLGMTLKDASAYNVQFHNGRPLFIDTLSFETYTEGRPWVAYQQFCKHFLAPLALMAHRHVDLGKLLRLNIDGVPLDIASSLLPWRTRLSFGLLMNLHLHARSIQQHAGSSTSAKKATAQKFSKTALIGIIDNLESTVRKLRWQVAATEWGDYYDATNYSENANNHKLELVAQYIKSSQARSVWDVGANTGRFSRVASNQGILTVAFDIDPAAVELNYLESRKENEENILPLIMDLTNPSTDLGWAGTERMGLASRGPADLVLALAIVHHLAISNNIPLEGIADYFAKLARALVIEFVPKEDSQVQRLFATRPDIFPDYTRAGFEQAFEGQFELQSAELVRDSERVLYLFARR